MDSGIATTAERGGHTSHWDRLAPLSGAAFFVLLLASGISSGETPDNYASGSTVPSDFAAQDSARKVSSLLAALGVVFLVLFASRLRAWLQPGRYRFLVKATDAAGNTDLTPARYRFKVMPR